MRYMPSPARPYPVARVYIGNNETTPIFGHHFKTADQPFSLAFAWTLGLGLGVLLHQMQLLAHSLLRELCRA